MLAYYLESGALLTGLSERQLRAMADIFSMYLIQGTSYKEALKDSLALLRPNQQHLLPHVRSLLANVNKSFECNALYKPAIIRLIAGDDSGFRKLGVNTRHARNWIESNRTLLRRILKSIKFDVAEIGPTHLSKIETETLKIVEKHSSWFASAKAGFLVRSGDRDRSDIINELLSLGLVAIRWYYPFREGLYLANTVRSSITNRGQSIIAYNTTQGRRRLQQQEDGSYFARETGSDNYAETASTADPRRMLDVDRALRRVENSEFEKALCDDTFKIVTKFVRDDTAQDGFISFVSQKLNIELKSFDAVIGILASRQIPYELALAKYLRLDETDVRFVLSQLRRAVA